MGVVQANEQGKWVKRKTLKEPLCLDVYDTAEELNNKYHIRHWTFPEDIQPADYPELERLQKIAEKHLKHYHNDFYLWDTLCYFQSERQVIWCLRDTGTQIIDLNAKIKEENICVYDYYLNNNQYFYLLNKGNIKKITKDSARQIIIEKIKKWAVA